MHFWNRLHLQTQLILISGLLLIIAIIGITMININTQHKAQLKDLKENINILGNNLAVSGSFSVLTENYAELEELLIKLANFPSILEIQVMDLKGHNYAHVIKNKDKEILPIYNLEIKDVPAQQSLDISKVLVSMGTHNDIVFWYPLRTSTQLGWIKIVASLEQLRLLEQEIIHNNIFIATIAILIDIIVLLLVLNKPANNLRQAINFASLLNKNPGITETVKGGSKESIQLIDALNESSKKIAQQKYELENEKQKLEENVQNRTQELFLAIKELNLMKVALEQSSSSIIITDNDANIKYVNDAFTKITGYSSEETINQNFSFIQKNEADSEKYSQIYKCIEEGQECSIELKNIRKNGEEYWNSLKFSPIHNDGNKITHFIFIQDDITRRRRDEELLHHKKKMEALGYLTGGVAHDYNNILGIILGYTDLLDTVVNKESKEKNYIDQISHAAMRAAKLTEKMLSFSRRKISYAQVVNINSLISNNQDLLEKTLTARIKINFELANDLWPVFVDCNDLEDAIINICINSMHAMKNNGQLTIKTSNENIDSKEISNANITSGDYVCLKISDTGCGMSEKTINQIFDPFFTTKGPDGTGLGLSQVYGFVKRSEGTIKVESEQDHGTSMLIYLPRYVGKNADIPDDMASETLPVSGDESILIVDDETLIREFISETLTQYGYRVFEASHSDKALQILETETIDLLLSDVIMEGMNGFELAEQVQKLYPKIKIQLISGFTGDGISQDEDKYLKEKILYKPFQSQDLLVRIRKLLD